jgi:predicted nucleotidyltransferase
MANQTLPKEFKEFLKLLNEHNVEYLLIGGYAVGFYGYPRATADIDVWVAISKENAVQLTAVFHKFGMQDPSVNPSLFLEKGKIIRMGLPPMRIEVLTEIDGVKFKECYSSGLDVKIDNQEVKLISKEDLRKNKKASGRYKDLDDLENLGD